MSFEVPEDRKYLESHEWVADADDTAKIGISDFAQDELGDVVFVELPDEGDRFEREEAFGVVESIKAVSDIYAPVAGTVVGVNDALVNEPELVNEDPYGEGWMVAIEPEGNLEDLLSPAEYREQTE